MTISRATGGVATGYLTAAGAKTFGAALARQFAADHGAACGNDYLCVAKKGYDAPTGLGTPNGIGAF